MKTLFEKLTEAGLPVISVNENGEIQMKSMALTQETIFSDICDEHFYPQKYLSRKRSEIRQRAAKSEAALVATQLKSLTPQQAVDYIETNVTNLASAKTVIKIMARMLIALRDAQFPELPDE